MHSLRVAILPRRSKCGALVLVPEGHEEFLEVTENRVPVMDQVACVVVEGEGFPDLLPDPFRRWIRGHVEVSDDSSAVVQDHQVASWARLHPLGVAGGLSQGAKWPNEASSPLRQGDSRAG